MIEGQDYPPETWTKLLGEAYGEVIQSMVSPFVHLPQIEVEPAITFFQIDIHIISQKRGHLCIQVSDPDSDRLRRRMPGVLPQQTGVAKI